MKKLASAIDEILAGVKASREEQAKLAAHSLSPQTAEPSISTELSVALTKTAASLRATAVEVTHADLAKFLTSLK